MSLEDVDLYPIWTWEPIDISQEDTFIPMHLAQELCPNLIEQFPRLSLKCKATVSLGNGIKIKVMANFYIVFTGFMYCDDGGQKVSISFLSMRRQESINDLKCSFHLSEDEIFPLRIDLTSELWNISQVVSYPFGNLESKISINGEPWRRFSFLANPEEMTFH